LFVSRREISLDGMDVRLLMLFGALVAAPGWSQEASRQSPAPRPAFDLTSPEVRKALRDAAATQIGQYTLAPAPAEPAEDISVEFTPPEPAPAVVEHTVPLPATPALADGILSSVVGIVFDELFDELIGDSVDEPLELDNRWLKCQLHLNVKSPHERWDSCGSWTGAEPPPQVR
jgi:hypothetical protein